MITWADLERYANLGFSVFPIRHKDKRPVDEWKPYQTRRANEDDFLIWLQTHPNMGLACATGAISGVIVIDADEGADEEWLQRLPPTATVKTAKGTHYYFKHPGKRVSNGVRVLPGIDVRADGGFVVVPPSQHPSGHIYRWITPPENGFADLPTEILAEIETKHPKTNGEAQISQTEISKLLRGTKEGDRNVRLTKIVGYCLAKGLSRDATWAVAELWNQSNKPPLDANEFVRTFESIHSREEAKRTAAEDFSVGKEGDIYTFIWPQYDVSIKISRVHDTRTGIQAELDVRAEPTGGLHLGRMILASMTDQEKLIRKLERRRDDILWSYILETIVRYISAEFERGEPYQMLRPSTSKATRDLIQNLLPYGETTVLYGDGGSGKSSAALALQVAVAGRRPILGFYPAEQKNGLYLDWESCREEHEDRLAEIVTGMSLNPSEIEGRIWYRKMTRGIADEIASLRQFVAEKQIGFVIVDSYAPAAGSDVEQAEAAVRVMNSLRSLGTDVTRLVITHVAKSDIERGNGARPFGSVFNWNLARSVWEIQRIKDPRLFIIKISHKKSNRGPIDPFPRYFRVDRADGAMIFAPTESYGDADVYEVARTLLKKVGVTTLDDIASAVATEKGIAHDNSLQAQIRSIFNRSQWAFQDKDGRWLYRTVAKEIAEPEDVLDA